jgi:hypothetical protein
MNTYAVSPTMAPNPTDFLVKAKAQIGRAHYCQEGFVREAILAGEMLLEMRSHFLDGHRGHLDSIDGEWPVRLADWLKLEAPQLTERTARRWMMSARRVIAHLLEIHAPNAPVKIALDGREHWISGVLTASEADCTPAMLTFRETFDVFLKDKTLSEAAACALDGESEDSRIARAANGKLKGGMGGNRRDYPRFFVEHFKAVAHGIRRWEKLAVTDPGLHAKMTEAIRVTVLGGHFKLEEKGRPMDFEGWPKLFSELMLAILKERVRPDGQ